ncbi:MAG: hypothetical protein ISEC1_P0527 [Thiomicrorhabdus sp.]|nr:MAG: hypothetical protein ISEC1_P0527 [Thiomicrorhabdus sp.]
MRLKHSFSDFMIILFATVILSGCLGITQPTESTITEAVHTHFNKQFADLFSVKTIVKKNGYKDGDGRYIAEITIIARAQRSLEEFAFFLMEDKNISPFEKIERGMSVGLLKITLPDFKAGEQIEFERHYLFIKSDNGWLLKNEVLQD